MPRILIVEDEVHLAQGLLFNLEAEGLEAVAVESGELALERLLKNLESFDAIVLDVMLPGINGFEVATTLREAQNYTPILMLTARARPEDVLKGFASGADDYLPKPFDPRELLVRIKVVLRRAQSFPERARIDEVPTLRFDGWQLDTRARQVLSPAGLVISLGNTDYRVLRLLLQHPNRPLSRDFLLNHVFEKDSTPFDRSIDVCISRLRQQLEPGLIKTVRNEGYMLTAVVVDQPE